MLPHTPNRIVAAALLVLGGLAWYAHRSESRTAAGNERGNAHELSRVDPESRAGNDPSDRLQESTMPDADADPFGTDSRVEASRNVAAPASNDRTPVQTPAVATDAAVSLADAMQHGDDRAPPIERSPDTTPAPTPGELADPAAYLRYQSRQQARLYASFEQHALIALSDMQRDLQRARAEHLPPELIAEGDEKMRKLAETLDKLHQQELDSAHPLQGN